MSGAIQSTLQALHLTSAPTAGQVAELKAEYKKYDQDHVFAFWDELSDAEKVALFGQLSGFKPARISVWETPFTPPAVGKPCF